MVKVFLPLSVLLTFFVIDFTQGRRPDYNSGSNQKYGYRPGAGGGGDSGMGTEDRPLEEGRRVTLDCGISVGNGQLLSCIWKHKLPVSSNQQQYGEDHVICGSAVEGNCVASTSQLDSYASRLRVITHSSGCQLEVASTDPRDSGDWDCHVIYYASQDSNGGQPPAELNTVQVYVGNRSEIAITKPNLQSDRSATIEYNLNSGNARIEATCTAYGGRPRPTFEWFVDDDRNEVTDKLAKFDEMDVSRDGTIVEGTITLSPTLDDLCNQLHLDQACRIFREEEDFQKINFNLICKARQGAFYVSESQQQLAKVIVEVSSSTSLLASCWSLALVFIAMISRQ